MEIVGIDSEKVQNCISHVDELGGVSYIESEAFIFVFAATLLFEVLVSYQIFICKTLPA